MDIPIKFTLKGKHYNGYLNSVSGAGQVFHLMINNYYIGQLSYTNTWVFYGNKLDGSSSEELTDLLGDYVTA